MPWPPLDTEKIAVRDDLRSTMLSLVLRPINWEETNNIYLGYFGQPEHGMHEVVRVEVDCVAHYISMATQNLGVLEDATRT